MGGVFINKDFSYAIFPLELINNEQYKGLSSDDKILYILLLNRKNFSMKNLNSFSDEKGVFVYYCNSQIQKHLNCCESTATKCLKKLEDVGLICKKYQKNGLPLKIYVNDIRGTVKQKIGKSPAPRDVSYDITKAEAVSKINRGNFGEMKNKKRRTHKNSSAF